MATDNLPYEGERTKANDKRIQPYTQGESSHNKTNGDLNKMDETSKKESLLTKWMKEDRRANPTCIVHWHRTSIQPPYQNGTRQSKARAATSLITASFSLTNALFLPMNNTDPRTPLANRTILFGPTNRTKLSLVFSSQRFL